MQAVVTLKHFDANSLEGPWGKDNKITRHTVDANISMYDLFETYLPAFRDSVVDGKAAGVMCSYNAVNGVPACASSFLLQDVLRDEWGFDGYVTSDSGAVKDILENHHYTSNWNDTVKAAIEAGCDMESASWPKDHPWSTGGPYIDYVPGVVRSGLMNESKLDDALRHTLDLRFRLGLFDPVENQPFWNAISEKDIRSDEHQARAVDATEQSFVLLRNEKNTLPFKAGKRVLVTGPHADDRGAILGNYIGEICADASYNCVKSPYEAIQAMNNASSGTTVLEPGCQSVLSTNTSGFDAALRAAKNSDLIIFVGGLDTSVERESMDRHNVTLPGVRDVRAYITHS
jgi:beta-glucosidase-like glycosyl hydrolase